MNNYIYKPLQSFVLYWLFPLLLVLTISLVYSIHFDTVTLCDDNGYSTLFQLKKDFTVEVANYRKSIVNYECYSDLRKQLLDYLPSSIKDASYEKTLDDQIRGWQISKIESLNRVRQLEAALKAIEPDFKLVYTYSNDKI